MNKFYRNNFIINSPRPLEGNHKILEIKTEKDTLYEVSAFIRTQTKSIDARTSIEFSLGSNFLGEYTFGFEDTERHTRIFKFIGDGKNFKIEFISLDKILVSYLIADVIEYDSTQIIDLTE